MTRWGLGGVGQRATTDEAVIRDWFTRRFPNALVAVATGPSGLLVVDEDRKHGGSLDMLDLMYGRLHHTLSATTPSSDGNPAHLYYGAKPEHGSRNSCSRLLEGIDTRGRGGFVVAPPAPGRAWIDPSVPVAPAPVWLLEELNRPRRADAPNVAPGRFPPDDLADALERLDPEDFDDNASWEPLLMGAHDAVGGDAEGRELFVAWSLQDPLFADHDGKIRDRWNSLRAGKKGNRTEKTLIHLVREADPDWRPPGGRSEDVFGEAVETEAPRSKLRCVTLSEVEAQEVDWLWYPYLPSEMFVLIDGDPDIGKSAIAYDIMSRVTRGDPMPFTDVRREPRNVLVVASEDPLGPVVRPRFEAAGADLARVQVVTESWRVDQLDPLEELIREWQPAIVWFDALMTVMAGKADTYKDHEVRERLDKLIRLFERHKCLPWCGRHLVKGEKRKAIYSGQGSIAFTAIARSAFLCGKNPDAPDEEYVFSHAKCNVAPHGPSLRYRIVGRPVAGIERHLPTIEWLGESRHDADEIATWVPSEERAAIKLLAAMVWLEGWLLERGDPAQPKEAFEAGKRAGHMKRTLQRAVEESSLIEVQGTTSSTRWHHVDRLSAD